MTIIEFWDLIEGRLSNKFKVILVPWERNLRAHDTS